MSATRRSSQGLQVSQLQQQGTAGVLAGPRLPAVSVRRGCAPQDREATIQCILCLRAKCETRKSFTCSTDCLRQHWGVHKELHANGARANDPSGPAPAPARQLVCLRLGYATSLLEDADLAAGVRATQPGMARLQRSRTALRRPTQASRPVTPSATAARPGLRCAAALRAVPWLKALPITHCLSILSLVCPGCRWAKAGCTPPAQRTSARC